jgi:hypothetical protein
LAFAGFEGAGLLLVSFGGARIVTTLSDAFPLTDQGRNVPPRMSVS